MYHSILLVENLCSRAAHVYKGTRGVVKAIRHGIEVAHRMFVSIDIFADVIHSCNVEQL